MACSCVHTMRCGFRHWAALLSVLAIICAPRGASAWCRTTTNQDFIATDGKPCDDVGKPIAWASKCTGYFVQSTGSPKRALEPSAARRALQAAFDAWPNALCPFDPIACTGTTDLHPSITARLLGAATCTEVGYCTTSPNANLILFRDDAWPHSDGDSLLALTTVSFDVATAEIYDVDMELNTALHRITIDGTGFDLESIVTHEAGHFFGLAHTQPTHGDAVMFPGSLRRTLVADDVCGICAAYDPKRAAACDERPRHGLSECTTLETSERSPSPRTAVGGGGCHCSAIRSARTSNAMGLGVFALLLARGRRRHGRAERVVPARCLRQYPRSRA